MVKVSKIEEDRQNSKVQLLNLDLQAVPQLNNSRVKIKGLVVVIELEN